MSKILMVYVSRTGNTELMAEIMVDYLKNQKHEVVTKTFDFDWIEPEELLRYDAVLVGTHTWDDGEMPYEVEDFYEDVEEVDLTGIVFGVFGSGDSFYDIFGGAVDLIGDRLEKLGADVLHERLKVDLEPDKDDIERCLAYAEALSKKIDKKVLEKA